MDDQEVSISEAASLKGVSRAAVHKAIREGRLPARWLSTKSNAAWKVDRSQPATERGVWRIRKEDVTAWEPVVSYTERGKRSAEARKRTKEDTNGENQPQEEER